MQAITVKFLGPTNHRGARYRAQCDAGSLTVGQDYSVGPETNATRVALALAQKLGWYGNWHRGSLPQRNPEAWVFVCASFVGEVKYRDLSEGKGGAT